MSKPPLPPTRGCIQMHTGVWVKLEAFTTALQDQGQGHPKVQRWKGLSKTPLPPTHHPRQLTRGCIQMHTGVWWVKLVAPNPPLHCSSRSRRGRATQKCTSGTSLKTGRRLSTHPPLSSSLSPTNAIINPHALVVPWVSQISR